MKKPATQDVREALRATRFERLQHKKRLAGLTRELDVVTDRATLGVSFSPHGFEGIDRQVAPPVVQAEPEPVNADLVAKLVASLTGGEPTAP